MKAMGKHLGDEKPKKHIEKHRSNTLNASQRDGSSAKKPKGRKEKYEAVVQLSVDKKMSERQISIKLDIPKSTVHRYLEEWRTKTPVKDLKGQGRPKKLDSGDQKFIRKLLREKPLSTVKDVVNALHSSRGKVVSASTAKRMLHDMNLNFSKPQIVPELSEAQKTKRVQWCKQHKKMKFDGVFFSDETYIELGCGNSGLWHKKGQRAKREKRKFPVKMMFWGAISTREKAPLIAVVGTMNTERYIELLRDKFFAWVTANRVEMSVFQQDNASCHVSKRAKQFFADHDVGLLEWPANSPDLNPIENIWGILKESVRKRNPQTKEDLEQFAQEEWVRIPQKTIKKTIMSVPKRCDQIISREGEKCDY